VSGTRVVGTLMATWTSVKLPAAIVAVVALRVMRPAKRGSTSGLRLVAPLLPSATVAGAIVTGSGLVPLLPIRSQVRTTCPGSAGNGSAGVETVRATGVGPGSAALAGRAKTVQSAPTTTVRMM